ncbi:MAG: 4'-phosphopantetheinyl transferase family protein [Frankiaceae bacterium]
MARGEHEIPPGEDWLTPSERIRAGGMRFTKRRSEYLLRRWVGKQAVAAAAGLASDPVALAHIEVANRRTGAPVVRVDGEPIDLDISLTDRAGWAVCLVVRHPGDGELRVGCDLEIVEPRSAGFVTDFLTAREQRYVAALPDVDRDVAANLLWSAKESALKVLQTGLRRDTRSVEVAVGEPAPGHADDEASAGWAPLEIRPAEGGRITGWWRRDGVFLVTVASELPLPPPAPLPGTADLTAATPVHSWMAQPLTP